MRLFVTFLLLAFSIAAVALMRIQIRDQSLAKIFGQSTLEKGERLYTFNPIETQSIRIQQGDNEVLMTRHGGDGQWNLINPVQDRADPRLAGLLHAYSRNLIVEEAIPRRDLENLKALTNDDKAPLVSLKSTTGELQASYLIGSKSSWEIYDEKEKSYNATTYISPKETEHKKSIYLCASNISELFENNSEKLRDHRPLFFQPQDLSSIVITLRGSSITLEKPSTSEPSQWTISKPIELKTDPKAITTLLEGLKTLTASKIYNEGEHTISQESASPDLLEIVIKESTPELDEKETTLTIQLPHQQKTTQCLAQVSDRPNTDFSLPIRSLLALPVSINQLRDRTLTGFRVNDLKKLEVSSPAAPPTQLSLIRNNNTGQFRWMSGYDDKLSPANEESVAQLFQAITTDKAIKISSDNANELAPYGLDRPDKTVRLFRTQNLPPVPLYLSEKNDQFFAHLEGSTSVLEIESSTYHSVPIYPHQWKDPLLWHFPIIDLQRLIIQRTGRQSLVFEYDYLTEIWSARKQGQDISPHLNQNRANKFLTFLEGASVKKWIPPGDPLANIALENPVYKLAAQFRENDLKKAHTLSLELARASKNPGNNRYYIRTNATPYIGVADLPFAERLAVDLFEK